MTKTRLPRKKIKQSYDKNKVSKKKLNKAMTETRVTKKKIKHRYNKIKVVKKKLLKLNIVITKKSRLLRNN